MRDFTDDLAELRRRVDDARAYLHVDTNRARLGDLEAEAARPDLWDDPEAARRVTTEMARVRDDVQLVDDLEGRLSDVETLHELAREEDDDSQEPEIQAGVASLASDLDKLELRALFTGEHDERDAICELHWGPSVKCRSRPSKDAQMHGHTSHATRTTERPNRRVDNRATLECRSRTFLDLRARSRRGDAVSTIAATLECRNGGFLDLRKRSRPHVAASTTAATLECRSGPRTQTHHGARSR